MGGHQRRLEYQTDRPVGVTGREVSAEIPREGGREHDRPLRAGRIHHRKQIIDHGVDRRTSGGAKRSEHP
jgi:hypothetical protein